MRNCWSMSSVKIVSQNLFEFFCLFRLSKASSTFSRPNPVDAFATNETVFYVPGMSVKCRYNSGAEDLKIIDGSASGAKTELNPPKIPVVEVETPGGTKLRKRSSIYVWFSLQSLEQMTISPCFLDFLEQTLQSTPVASTPDPAHSEEGIGAVETLDSTIAALPMDTLVFVSIQPSQVYFNCRPMSRVECLLHIPSLDATFSNIRHSSETQTSFTFPEKGISCRAFKCFF